MEHFILYQVFKHDRKQMQLMDLLNRTDQFESLESIWGKIPTEEPLWDPPALTHGSPLPAATEELLIGEDEMAAWLDIQINVTDKRADLDRQTVAGSSDLMPDVLLEKAAESDHCQILQPVLPVKDAKSDCQLGPSETRTRTTSKKNIRVSNMGGVNSNKEKRAFDWHSEVSMNGSDGNKTDVLPGQSMSSKRLRTTAVHNLSERRRRSRINERLKTLQELIPRSNKLDKASLLDVTITYVESLQMQVKMLSRRLAMCIQQSMTPLGPATPWPQMNQFIQAPMLQMPHQHGMAVEMLPCLHSCVPYHIHEEAGSSQINHHNGSYLTADVSNFK